MSFRNERVVIASCRMQNLHFDVASNLDYRSARGHTSEEKTLDWKARASSRRSFRTKTWAGVVLLGRCSHAIRDLASLFEGYVLIVIILDKVVLGFFLGC